MPTREIPSSEWVGFFRGFSRQHAGWLCSVEVFGPSFGSYVEAKSLPLAGVSAELGHGDSRIQVAVGDRRETHLTHAISAPTHVWLKQAEDGADEALEIEGPETKTLLRFRVAARPDTVDETA